MPKIKTVLDIILQSTNIVAKASINASAIPAGHYCELFYPKEPVPNDVPQVLGKDSQKFIYSVTPNKKQTLIVIGLFSDTFNSSDKTFDPYNGQEPYILTHKDQKIPVNTRIKIYRGNDFFIMKIISHKVYPSVDGQIYFKNILVPWN